MESSPDAKSVWDILDIGTPIMRNSKIMCPWLYTSPNDHKFMDTFMGTSFNKKMCERLSYKGITLLIYSP